MPSLPDIPGKSLVTSTGRRAGKVAAGTGLAMIAVGGYVARRLIRRGGGDESAASADPIAETPTAPPGAEAPETPEPREAPEVPEPSAGEPPAPEESPASDRPPAADEAPPPEESPATAPEPGSEESPTTTGTDAPTKPEAEPGNISKDEEPHHALNNPVGDPDPTEWPDPYEQREDPRDPADPDGEPFGEEPHSPTNAESTSEPHPREDPEAGDRAEPPKRDKLDD